MSNSICVFAVILLGVSSINADGFQQELQKLRTGNMEKLTSGTMEDMTGFDESELTSLMNSMEMSLKIEMEDEDEEELMLLKDSEEEKENELLEKVELEKEDLEHAVLQYKTQSEEALLNELDSILKRRKIRGRNYYMIGMKI